MLFRSNEKLIISGKLNADVVYAEELLAMINENTKDELSHNSPEIDQTFKITELLKLDLTIDLKQLKWDKFIADDLTGSIKLNSGKIFSDKLQFKTCEGLVELSGFCETRVEKILVMGTAQLNGINIPKLFYSLDNFGQDLLQDKNLRGKGSVTANFNTEFSSNFSLIPESLKCESELTIEKGELIDFKPLEALSKYVELSELKRIQFNTLKTQVFIKDKKIELSKTEINNSALNIKISGSQDFNYNIDYRVSLLMSELMAKKPRKNKQLDEELRLVENDPENKRTVFLKLQGNVDDIKISYDRKSVKEKIKDDLRTEGKTLKNILQEEFKIFKRDTTMKKNPVQSDQKKPDAKIKQRKNKEIIESDNEEIGRAHV